MAAPTFAMQSFADAPLDEVDVAQPVNQTVVDVAGWVLSSGDNRGQPFAIIDKRAAQVLVFGEDGRLRGMAPALIGSAVGDHSTPGVGDRELSDIAPEERTTPAGRFVAAYGPAAGGKRVLWVDYATAISLHPVVTTNKKEKRQTRLGSPTPADNRITFGCINVSPSFYKQVVRPTFEGREGVFYVLPEIVSIQQALPGFEMRRASAYAERGERRGRTR